MHSKACPVSIWPLSAVRSSEEHGGRTLSEMGLLRIYLSSGSAEGW